MKSFINTIYKNSFTHSGYSLLLLVALSLSTTSCKKLVDVDAPVTSINVANVFSDDASAVSVMTGVYATMSAGSFVSGSASLSFFSGLSADEFSLYAGGISTTQQAYYKNLLTPSGVGSESWNSIYQVVFSCNSVLEGLAKSTSVSAATKNQLTGEAKFVRAFCYFYLTNLYGDVPLVVSTDYNANLSLQRSPVTKIYDQVIADLSDAQGLLSVNFLNSSLQSYPGNAERVRPTKWAANALLARVYLYKGDFTNAELQASLLINNSAVFSLEAINKPFTKNNNEAIWQLQPVASGKNTEDALFYVLPASGPSSAQPALISSVLLSAFEPGDGRRTKWIDSVVVSGGTKYLFPGKYKNISSAVTEYLTVLRLGEQFLIRAEARAQLKNITGSQSDLNTVRNRAGLANTIAADQPSLVNAVLRERQVELFSEFGHRWLDIKRAGVVDAVMTQAALYKGTVWTSSSQLYPVPAREIQFNKALTQNPGY